MDNFRQTPDYRHTPAPKQPTTVKASRSKSVNRKVLNKIIIVAVILGMIGLAYGYIHTRSQLHQLSSNPKAATQSETQNLTDKVGKLVELPVGETPTVATVNDSSKLKSQTFFARSKNGDKVLIFSKAGQAILYRPSTDKVIQFSVVNLGNQ